LQYAIARINSVLSKAKAQGIYPVWNVEHSAPLADESIPVYISSPLEREILLMLVRLPEFVEVAYVKREPSVISEFAYVLAQKFSTLYNNLTIMNEPDLDLKRSRLKIAELTKQALVYALNLLGIESPERMLRKG
jgi:arginyl-tRNA synthetase